MPLHIPRDIDFCSILHRSPPARRLLAPPAVLHSCELIWLDSEYVLECCSFYSVSLLLQSSRPFAKQSALLVAVSPESNHVPNRTRLLTKIDNQPLGNAFPFDYDLQDITSKALFFLKSVWDTDSTSTS